VGSDGAARMGGGAGDDIHLADALEGLSRPRVRGTPRLSSR
jgi:hypothetical protein